MAAPAGRIYQKAEASLNYAENNNRACVERNYIRRQDLINPARANDFVKRGWWNIRRGQMALFRHIDENAAQMKRRVKLWRSTGK